MARATRKETLASALDSYSSGVAAAILDGSARIFAEQGEQASMNQIAAAAGVARATVRDSFALLARQRVRSDPERFEHGITQSLRRLVARGQGSGDIAGARLAESLIGLIAGVLWSTPALGKVDTIATITQLFLDGARARGPRGL